MKEVFQAHILPMLGAQSALYAWMDQEFCSAQMVDCVNIPKREIPAIREFVFQDPRARSVLSHPCPVIARDVFFPETGNKKDELDAFFKKRPKHKGFDYFDTASPGRITLALRDPSFCAGIHRRFPCDKPWTIRDVRILEYIRPHLMQALRTILLSEELVRNRTLLNALADCSDPLAVVNHKWKVNFFNGEFGNLFRVKSGGGIPKEIQDLLDKGIHANKNGRGNGSASIEIPDYGISGSIYRIKLVRVNGKISDLNDTWLLRLTKAVPSHLNVHEYLTSAGLTGREAEICDLAREGLDDREIAGELFISPHTVKAHLKKIHEKLDVHTRAQLIATLNR